MSPMAQQITVGLLTAVGGAIATALWALHANQRAWRNRMENSVRVIAIGLQYLIAQQPEEVPDWVMKPLNKVSSGKEEL